MNLSLDDKTANKMLWISDNGSKVCRRTEEICPVLDRPERYEYSPQVSQKTYIYMTFTWSKQILSWCFTNSYFPVFFKGAVQRGYLEHEGLLGGGVLWLGGNWSHLHRSRTEGKLRAERPWRKWGVLGSVLVRNKLPDLVQRHRQGHKQCPVLLHYWSLSRPAGRYHKLLCSDRWGCGEGGGAAV